MTTKEFVALVEDVIRVKEGQAAEALSLLHQVEDVRYHSGYWSGVMDGLHRMVMTLAPNDAARMAARLLLAEADGRLEELIEQHSIRVRRAAQPIAFERGRK
uniref:Uncharacterized protein n=1 Tax=Geobacter metallireducens TaxID=28232 RepID=A0A831XL19_GEOME